MTPSLELLAHGIMLHEVAGRASHERTAGEFAEVASAAVGQGLREPLWAANVADVVKIPSAELRIKVMLQP